jgi:hypothetical protein
MGNSVNASVTPLVLTYNEEPNIGRTLESLRWAERVVVLDSGSTDKTEEIAKGFCNVDWRDRRFDNHRAQWEYGIHGTDITSDFVLALDADMSVRPAFVEELKVNFLVSQCAGGVTPFEFRILGYPLAGSIYPAQLRLFRRNAVKIGQHGHTQEFFIDSRVYRFETPIIHDDRKSIERWVSSQASYSALEARRIAAQSPPRWRDRLRELGVMPLIAGALAYIRAGGPLRGAAAVRYAHERAAYECLLAIRLMSARLEKQRHSSD